MKKDIKSSKKTENLDTTSDGAIVFKHVSLGALLGGLIGVGIVFCIAGALGVFSKGSGIVWNNTSIVTPMQAKDWYGDKASILYESADSETGAVEVHYKDSAWATFTNNSLYLLQQYLAPKNKHGSLYDEVSGLPEFQKHGASAVYYAVNNDSGEFTELNKDVVYDAISAGLGTTNFTVFVEWDTNDGKPLDYTNTEIGAKDPNMTDDHWFYQYQYKYADVSTLCTYTDSAGLFRTYVEYLQNNDLAKPSTDANTTEDGNSFSVDSSLYGDIVEGSGTETTPAGTNTGSTTDTGSTTETTPVDNSSSETTVTEVIIGGSETTTTTEVPETTVAGD